MAETRKSIVFQAKFDTSELPQVIETIKRQMNQANIGSRLSQQGMGGIVPIPKSEDIQKTKRELEMLIRTASQDYEKKLRSLQQENELAKALQSRKKESIRDSRELELHEKNIAQNLERRLRLMESIKQKEGEITGGLDQLGGKDAGKAGGAGKALGGKIPPIVSDAIIAAMASKAIQQFAALPREIATATGGATQGLVGNQLQSLQGGDIVKTMAFKQEWQDSLRMAAQERKDPMREEMARWTSMKGFIGGLIGGDMERGFQSEQMQEQMKNAQDIYTAKMQGDPKKMAAVNMYSQNFMRDLQAQRMMGMSDRGYFGAGGYQERANMAGFNPELALGMSTQIQAAGGSTRGMGMASLGLQAQRGFDLTNAGGVLGRISGSAGGAGASEQIFKKLMEESIKAGLDKSEFREEQRRFADITSGIISGAGVRTSEDAARVLSGFTRMLGGSEPTVRGLEGAKGAYGQVQELSGQSSGRMGAMQMAGFMKNPQLRKLGAAGMGAFAEMHEEFINPSNPEVITAARTVGMSPQAFADAVKDMKRSSRLITSGLDPEEVKAFASSSEGKALNLYSAESIGSLSRRGSSTLRKIQDQLRFAYSPKSIEEMTSLTSEALGRGPSGQPGGILSRFRGEDYESKRTSVGQRMGDTAVAASGQVSQEFLENFREFSKAITPSTAAVSEWTKMLLMSAQVLRYTAEGDKASAQKALADAMAKSSKTQNQVTR